VKKLRKSVNICQSYHKNKSGTFFYGPRCTYLLPFKFRFVGLLPSVLLRCCWVALGQFFFAFTKLTLLVWHWKEHLMWKVLREELLAWMMVPCLEKSAHNLRMVPRFGSVTGRHPTCRRQAPRVPKSSFVMTWPTFEYLQKRRPVMKLICQV